MRQPLALFSFTTAWLVGMVLWYFLSGEKGTESNLAVLIEDHSGGNLPWPQPEDFVKEIGEKDKATETGKEPIQESKQIVTEEPPPPSDEDANPVLEDRGLFDGSICVLTVHDGGGKMKAPHLSRLAVENKRRYCEIHGHLFFHANNSIDPTRSAAWNKILHMQQVLLDPRCDWLFYTDADAFITNPNVTLQQIIGMNRSEDLIFPKDGTAYVNTGVWFIRRSPYSIAFLTRVYAKTEFIQHGWWEQAAISSMLSPEAITPTDLGHFVRLPQRLLTSLWPLGKEDPATGWRRGDFVVHFLGRNWETGEPWPIDEWLQENRECVSW